MKFKNLSSWPNNVAKRHIVASGRIALTAFSPNNFENSDDLGCGCFNEGPINFYYDQDEDGYLDEIFELLFFEPLRFGLAFIPGGNILPVPFNVLNDKPYDDRISTSPSISTLESSTTGTVRALQAVLDPKKDVTGKNVKDVFTLMSLLSNYPLTILGRPLGYLQDVSTGRVEPEGPIDFIRGVVTGKTGRKQRK